MPIIVTFVSLLLLKIPLKRLKEHGKVILRIILELVMTKVAVGILHKILSSDIIGY
jgi:predicted Co/Zn/Cd cation transporter (cation efflux family)